MTNTPENLSPKPEELLNEQICARISADGAWLESLRGPNGPILFPKDIVDTPKGPKARGGCHVCLPNFGPAKENMGLAQHGFGRDGQWQVQQKTPDKVTLRLEQVPESYAGLLAELTYTLTEKGINMELQATNGSNDVMRIAPGFHPYFASGAAEAVLVDGQPFALSELDPAKFLHDQPTELQAGNQTVQLTAQGLPKWVLWTDGAGQYVCLEPTQAGSSFTENATLEEVLAPQESRSWSLQIEAA